MLAHEAWLGLRVSRRAARRGFVRVREARRGRARSTRVFDWHGGRTLEQMLASRPARSASARSSARRIAVARALGRLHRQGVIHRDIKPANLHLRRRRPLAHPRPGRRAVRARGRGAARAARRHAELHQSRAVGRAPRRRRRQRPVRARRHALPVARRPPALRRDRALPGGALPARPGRRCRASGPTCRSGSIIWCARRWRAIRAQRFETAEELLLALERGASRPLAAPGRHAAGAPRPGGAVEDRARASRCCSTCCWWSGCCSCRAERGMRALQRLVELVSAAAASGAADAAGRAARGRPSRPRCGSSGSASRAASPASPAPAARRRRSPRGSCRGTAWTGPSRWARGRRRARRSRRSSSRPPPWSSGQRSGTSWNSAPLPAPSAAKQSMNSSVVSASDAAARPHSDQRRRRPRSSTTRQRVDAAAAVGDRSRRRRAPPRP